MKKRIVALLCGLSAAGLSSTAGADLPDVRARGTLRVAAVLDPNRPEFFAERPDLPPGFDHEILKGFADLHRLKLDVVPVASWDALIPALLSSKADVLAGRLTATETRRKSIDFTTEVFPYRLVVITRKPTKVVASVDDLRREKVGTMRGTTMAEVIASLGVPPDNVVDDIPAGGFVPALKSGRVTAVVWGVESAIASQKEDPDLQLGTFVGSPASLAFGVRKTDPALRAALDDYIEAFRKSPAWNRLLVKYFGASAPAILKSARGE
jgi:ABC-type amino acid transport substrate-binding protein